MWRRKIVSPEDIKFFPWFQKVIKAPQLQYPTSAVDVTQRTTGKKYRFRLEWSDEDTCAIDVEEWTNEE